MREIWDPTLVDQYLSKFLFNTNFQLACSWRVCKRGEKVHAKQTVELRRLASCVASLPQVWQSRSDKIISKEL